MNRRTVLSITGIVFNIIPYKDTEKVWNILTPNGIIAVYVRKPYAMQDCMFLNASFDVERSGKFYRLQSYEVCMHPKVVLHEYHYLRTLCSEVLYQLQIDHTLYSEKSKAQALYTLLLRIIQVVTPHDIEREVLLFLIHAYHILGGNLALRHCARTRTTEQIVLFLPSLGGFLSRDALTIEERKKYNVLLQETYQEFLRVLLEIFRVYTKVLRSIVTDEEEEKLSALTKKNAFQTYKHIIFEDIIHAYEEYLGIELRSYRVYTMFLES